MYVLQLLFVLSLCKQCPKLGQEGFFFFAFFLFYSKAGVHLSKQVCELCLWTATLHGKAWPKSNKFQQNVERIRSLNKHQMAVYRNPVAPLWDGRMEGRAYWESCLNFLALSLSLFFFLKHLHLHLLFGFLSRICIASCGAWCKFLQ